ncbi:lipase family protein [Rhodococcus erythropolis]|uniref:lipase family protein n=1 Tax=Rhodococcus erythropolis TaxID=1833 RepID=UPI003671A035
MALSATSPVGVFPANATRIMYRSTSATGDPIAVTGTVLEPPVPWSGPGERPLVSYAPGTIGVGDQCAHSHLLLDNLIHYAPPFDLIAEAEVGIIDSLLARGLAVVVTDYEGLGTASTHPYLNPLSEAPAVIDAARAAQGLTGTSIPAEGSVAFWGYSQGGGAAGGAAEHASTYAPELKVAGSFVGAPPADLATLLATLDGGILTGAIGYFLNGLQQTYPQTRPVIDRILNDSGRAMLAQVATQCVPETTLNFGFHLSNEFTSTGESIPDELAADPVTRSVLDELRLGNRAPSAPALVAIGGNDDIVPPASAMTMIDNWRAGGAAVEVADATVPAILPSSGIAHVLNAPLSVATRGIDWLEQQFTQIATFGTN